MCSKFLFSDRLCRLNANKIFFFQYPHNLTWLVLSCFLILIKKCNQKVYCIFLHAGRTYKIPNTGKYGKWSLQKRLVSYIKKTFIGFGNAIAHLGLHTQDIHAGRYVPTIASTSPLISSSFS